MGVGRLMTEVLPSSRWSLMRMNLVVVAKKNHLLSRKMSEGLFAVVDDEFGGIDERNFVRSVAVDGQTHERVGKSLELLGGGGLFNLGEGLRVRGKVELAVEIELGFVLDFDGVLTIFLIDCQGDHLLSRMMIAEILSRYREDKKLFLYQVDEGLTEIAKSSMISGS